MSALWQDVRYAWRAIWMRPGFSAVVCITLALGIGATTAMFSVVDHVLLAPLPYQAPEQLVALRGTGGEDGGDVPISYPEYLDWKARGTGMFSDVIAWYGHGAVITGRGDPAFVVGDGVSARAAALLGVQPLAGRAFRPEEEEAGSERVVMIGAQLWHDRFAGDPRVIGQTLDLDGQPYTIVGVLPSTPNALLPTELSGGRPPDFWIPLRLTTTIAPRSLNWLWAVARVRPGITPAQLRERMRAVSVALAHDGIDSTGLHAVPLTKVVAGETARPLTILLAAVTLLLLIACANVANLLLARGAARERELALRAALGAGRGRIVAQLLPESVVRALCGGAAGIVLAYAGVWAAHRWLSVSVPRFGEVRIDARVLAFVVALSLVAGVLFGVAPALRGARADLNATLRAGGRGLLGSVRKDRVQRSLIVLEVALSFVLLVGAGLLLRTLQDLLAVKRGFDADHVLTAQVGLNATRYPDSTVIRSFYGRLLGEARGIPGVEMAALASELPGLGGTNGGIGIEGETFPPNHAPIAEKRIVSSGYFETMRAGLAAGRSFRAGDAPGAPPVVIVNRTFVNRWMHGVPPVGHRVDFRWDTHGLQTIVGVIDDMREGGPRGPPLPAIYIPAEQHPTAWMNLVVRSNLDRGTLVAAIRRRVKALDPAVPLIDVRTLDDVVGTSVASQRLSASVLSVFATLALVLAAVGLYGVISYWVVRRSQELGIRAALGAQRGDLLGLVMREGATFLVSGLVVGAAGAVASARLMASELFGVRPTDVVTYVSVAVVLAAVSLLATVVPALRAARADPMSALRAEQ